LHLHVVAPDHDQRSLPHSDDVVFIFHETAKR
jgi:hypothetical protein